MDNKIDMSFLDLIVWSRAACIEMKRLCTRVAKKKDKKGIQQGLQSSQPIRFNPLVPLSGQKRQTFPLFPTQPLQSVPYPTSFQVPPRQAPVTQQPVQQAPLPQQPVPVMQQPVQQSDDNADVTSINARSLNAHSADAHTRFLSRMAGIEKAFRIPSTIRHSAGQDVPLEKKQSHADQGSDMNVISAAIASWTYSFMT